MIPNSPEKIFTVLMRVRINTQAWIKDYAYIANQTALSRATSQAHTAHEGIKRDMLFLSSAFKDPSPAGLIRIIDAKIKQIDALMHKPYSSQNLAIIFNNGKLASDGLVHIAQAIHKTQERQNLYRLDRMRMLLNAIAQAYLFVRERDKKLTQSLQELNSLLGAFRKELDQLKAHAPSKQRGKRTLKNVLRLWQTIDSLCADSQAGDLPSIVFQTTTKLDKELVRYFEALN
jgi:hypothetical protein